MAEYIEMEKLWDELQHTPFYDNRDRDAMEDMALSISKEDVSPVVHGKWVEFPRAHYFKCSNCRKTVPYRKGLSRNGESEYKYCPNCGARMNLED